MFRSAFRILTIPVLAALVFSCVTPVQAGTTGHITGRIVDSQTQAPLAGVTVTATSPSQSATTTTDASGHFGFLSLAPDSYTVGFERDGYDPVSQAGISVFADQTQTLNIAMVKTLKTIARVTSRTAGNLIKPGTTSDVYSVNATQSAASASLVGPGGLSNAYGAIASVPGVVVDTGESGWFQQVHIRGGDIDQVGYELDGIPVNRVYDNAPQTMLSSLGQQELQVYTGGTPAGADAQGIAGYVNQVVKTGTYPGFGMANLSVGMPAFYHRASVEAGGSTPDRLFSYYIGISGANQDYRYVDQNQGAGNSWWFYPMNTYAGGSFVYVGGDAPNLFAPGNTFAIANTNQRDTVMNFHAAIPHKHSPLRDDVQLLYLTSHLLTAYNSSVNDIGVNLVPGITGSAGATNLSWNDGLVYNGPMFQPVNPSNVAPYFYASAPLHTFGGPLPTTARDTNDNGVAVTKLQYQHAFSDRAFVRIYGYTLYSNWFIDGPNSANEAYGAEIADYEIPDHTYGGNISLTDQISNKHLLSLSGSYTAANLQRYSNSFFRGNPNVATLVDASGNCYNGTTGAATICYDSAAQLGAATLQGGVPAITGAAAAAGAQYLATSGGLIANLNQVHSRFAAVSLSDEWRPADRFVFNIGARMENFTYLLGNTDGNPARAFWFTQYNKDYCYGPGDTSPVQGSLVAGSVVCPNPGEQTLDALGPAFQVQNVSGGQFSATRFEPRLSFTYTLNPDTVLRGSWGVYARPQNTSWVRYNTVQSDLASFLGTNFYSYGFRTPDHDISPDTSSNYDVSVEHHLHNTDLSFKLTPFYRSTQNQLQNFFINPLNGLESGLNVGHQVSDGVELAIQKGDFTRNGLAGQLAFTFTHSAIKYNNFPGTNRNVIDNLNASIQQYNSYTFQCAQNENTPQCGNGTYAANGAATLANSAGTLTFTNPYYCTTVSAACPYSAQPLLDRNAYYATYDVIPGPFAAANGYATPFVASLVLNYKHDKFTITPSLAYTSGSEYGSPLTWPGYIPQSCTAALTTNPTLADPSSCASPTGLPLFLPNPYHGYSFDSIGAYKQPWRFQANLALGYDISPKISAHVTLTSLVDTCGQRGYAWDQSKICMYGVLPSNIFAPQGNFYPNNLSATAPPQMKYPYAFFFNDNNTGFEGVTLPLQVTFDLQFKL